MVVVMNEYMRSLEALWCHSAELVDVVGVHEVGIDDGGLVCFFDGFLGDLDAVVDDEEGVVGAEDLVVERDAVEVLFEEGFQHLVVLAEGLFLLLNGQTVQQNLVESFEKVIQVFKLFVLFWSEFLELVLHLL
jgi:hypothetical protein